MMITVHVELAGVLEAGNSAYLKVLSPGWRTQRNPSDVLCLCWHWNQIPPYHYLVKFGKMSYENGEQDFDMFRMLPRKVSFNVTGVLIGCSEVIKRFPALFSVMYPRCCLWSNCNSAVSELSQLYEYMEVSLKERCGL